MRHTTFRVAAALLALTAALALAQNEAPGPTDLALDASVIPALGSAGGHIIAFGWGEPGTTGRSTGLIGGFRFTTLDAERVIEMRNDPPYDGLVIPAGGLRVEMPYPGTRATVNVVLPTNPPEVTATVLDVDGNPVEVMESYWTQGQGVFDFYADEPTLAAILLEVTGPGASLDSAAVTP